MEWFIFHLKHYILTECAPERAEQACPDET